MSGAEIAAEIAAALAEVGSDTGNGPLIAKVIRAPVDAPQKPWDVPSITPPTEYDITVIRDAWTFGQIDGTLIRADDLKLMAEATGVLPTVADKLTLQEVTYEIVNVWPEAVGGAALYYIIQARK